MTLQQLSYFLAAAEHGSFSAAASELHLAQPSLSEQIRRLEGELGVALFARTGRGLELTEAGRAFAPHAEATLAAAGEAADAVRGVRALAGGTLTFGTFGNAPYYVIADLAQDFRARHPDVALRLVGTNSAEVADAVRDGRLEAALVFLPVDDRALDVRPVLRDELLYLSRDPARAAAPVTMEALAAAPLILSDARYGWSDPTRRTLSERAQRAGIKLEPVIEVEDIEAAMELAARGLGDTVGPDVIGLARGFARRLHAASFDPPIHETVAFVTRRNAHLSPATRAFMALAERRIAQLGRRSVSD